MSNLKKIFSKKSGDQFLPNYGILYFDHLISELDHLLLVMQNESDYINEANELKDKRKSNPANLSWNELFSLELLISKILPKERLSREVWRLRLRYRDVVGLKQYENYLASKPPDLTSKEMNENDYRGDIEYLLAEIYLRYVTTPYNENLRNIISGRVTTVILAGLSIVIIVAVSFNSINLDSLGSVTLLLVMFIGAMGGLLSMQQRYQNISRDGDPVDNISLLQQGWSRLFMPAVSGAIFSILLYMIIVGGLIEGKLFPQISIPGIDGRSPTKNIIDAIKNSYPKDVGDYAKLVVWSFLAGFAERFVPDTLTRFTSTRDTNSKST